MIELNKVYTDGDFFRTPIAVMNNTVAYWFASNEEELGKEVVAGHVPVEVFKKNTQTICKANDIPAH